jgi:hypothetical protein
VKTPSIFLRHVFLLWAALGLSVILIGVLGRLAVSYRYAALRDVAADTSLTHIDRLLDRLPLGRVVFAAPDSLDLDELATAQLSVAVRPPAQELLDSLAASLFVDTATIHIGSDMGAYLRSGAFAIHELSPTRQAVTASSTTEWFWEIKPLKSGVQKLTATLFVYLDLGGRALPRPVQTYHRQIEVHVSTSRRVADWVRSHQDTILTVLGTLVAAVLGALVLQERSESGKSRTGKGKRRRR